MIFCVIVAYNYFRPTFQILYGTKNISTPIGIEKLANSIE
jgi:hypothetical protein